MSRRCSHGYLRRRRGRGPALSVLASLSAVTACSLVDLSDLTSGNLGDGGATQDGARDTAVGETANGDAADVREAGALDAGDDALVGPSDADDARGDAADAVPDAGPDARPDAPDAGVDAADAGPTSCHGSSMTCGTQSIDCCASPLVAGGLFNRSNDVQYPATVSDFRLDAFEVTVGRFRRFVAAGYGTQVKPPASGVGSHPTIASSGWNDAWNAGLPASTSALVTAIKCNSTYQTWTDTPSTQENLPVNCLTWYIAFSFCAWDGGRLPTEAEWNYAAAGGGEQRSYPWSVPPSSTTIDNSYAAYNCMGDGSGPGICSVADLRRVGSYAPKGNGKWGHADLSGNVQEWLLDYRAEYPLPCDDCANLLPAAERAERNWGWASSSPETTDQRNGDPPGFTNENVGVRCARQP